MKGETKFKPLLLKKRLMMFKKRHERTREEEEEGGREGERESKKGRCKFSPTGFLVFFYEGVKLHLFSYFCWSQTDGKTGNA
jgi:hypothetical protein